jgi:hypothetical protein
MRVEPRPRGCLRSGRRGERHLRPDRALRLSKRAHKTVVERCVRHGVGDEASRKDLVLDTQVRFAVDGGVDRPTPAVNGAKAGSSPPGAGSARLSTATGSSSSQIGSSAGKYLMFLEQIEDRRDPPLTEPDSWPDPPLFSLRPGIGGLLNSVILVPCQSCLPNRKALGTKRDLTPAIACPSSEARERLSSPE